MDIRRIAACDAPTMCLLLYAIRLHSASHVKIHPPPFVFRLIILCFLLRRISLVGHLSIGVHRGNVTVCGSRGTLFTPIHVLPIPYPCAVPYQGAASIPI